MNVFEIVKENVTARQAAEAYGLKVGRQVWRAVRFTRISPPV